MKSIVAVIAPGFNPSTVAELKAAIEVDGAKCTVISDDDRRVLLRRIMDLAPDQCQLCLFCDNDGRTISALSAALDPQIPAIAWAPEQANTGQFASMLSDCLVLVSFGESATLVTQVIRPLLHTQPVKRQAPEFSSPQGKLESPVLTLSTTPPPSASASAPDRYTDDDTAVYQQLEAMMSLPVKDLPKPQPVPVQPAAIDFSTPLRQLMSHGQALAQSLSSPEVLGAHYLAALDSTYSALLTTAGLPKEQIQKYLNESATRDHASVEAVVSDEAFDAVARAKERTRKREGACIKVGDFIAALLEQTDGSVAALLADSELQMADIEPAIRKMEELDEPCASPFFAPSSLDQDSFYEFDPAQVRTIEERLRTLPGFQKAAARVAEPRTGHTQHTPAAAAPTFVSPVTAAEPPDKPEIIKVSPDFPEVADVEHIADRLLEGQIVAFPADTMYALACDAGNPVAVSRLREAAKLSADKPLSILINSTSQLKHLVKADLDALEPLFDDLWPGPLTLVFKAAGSIARHVSSGGTIAVRQPADNTSLSILSMFGRPLAVTSYNNTPPQQAVDINRIADELSGSAAIVVTHGEPVPQTLTTVVELKGATWKILREGVISGEAVLQYQTP